MSYPPDHKKMIRESPVGPRSRSGPGCGFYLALYAVIAALIVVGIQECGEAAERDEDGPGVHTTDQSSQREP
jgi:hypothetical protein